MQGGTHLQLLHKINYKKFVLYDVSGDVMDAIFCGVTKIRLVSSGNSNNLITLTIDKVKAEETSESGVLCPSVPNQWKS